MRSLAEGQREGHAYSFVHRFYLPDGVPIVPVFLNAYYPPNQPSPARCVALGEALRRAVEAFPGDARIGVMASGGLSHFVVDEAFDHALIDALRRKDAAFFRNAPLTKLMSGSSEMRNWICLAGRSGRLELAVGQLCAGLSHAGAQRHGTVFCEFPLSIHVMAGPLCRPSMSPGAGRHDSQIPSSFTSPSSTTSRCLNSHSPSTFANRQS